MEKQYKTLELIDANLQEILKTKARAGYKNIIGILVDYKNEKLFYSILDDCFFRILPPYNPITDNWKQYIGKIFVELYELKTFGMELYEKLKIDYITKQELIKNKKLITFGHYSDLEYENLNLETNVDYEHPIEENIITTEEEYVRKLEHTII